MRVLGAATAGILVVDRAGLLRYANRAAEAMLGLPSTTVGERSVHTWTVAKVGGKCLPIEELPVFRALQTSEPQPPLEHSFQRPDGTWVVLSQSAMPLRDEGGVVESVVVSLADVTEHTRATDRLRQAEAMFRTLLERSANGYAMHRGGRVVYANPALLSLLGYSSDDLPSLAGRPVIDFVIPEDRPAVRERLRVLTETHRSVPPVEERLLRRDGGAVAVEESGLPLVFEGKPTILTILVDISERKRTERELATSLSLLTATLESTTDGLLAVDLHGRITAFNAKFVQMWRVAKETLDPRDHERLLAYMIHQVKDPAAFVAKTRQLAANPEVESDEVIELRDERLFERYSRPQRVAGRCVGRVSSYRDVTMQRRVVLEQAKLLAEIGAKHELLQSVVDYAPVGISFRRGSDFVYELVNPAFKAVFGELPQPGLTHQATAAEVIPAVKPILEHVLATGEPHRTVEERVRIRRTPRGPLEDVYLNRAYVRVPSPRGAGVLAIVLDTTAQVNARRRVEELVEAARQQAAELETIHASITDGLVVCDASGIITVVNDAQTRLFGGAHSTEAMGMTLSEYADHSGLRGPDGERFAANELPLARALRGETLINLAVRAKTPTRGDVYLRANATPIRDGSGAIVGAVVLSRDVTDLIELDRLKDQFIRVAAHELKTPAAIMKGYAQMLLRSTEPISASARSALEAIDRGAGRIDTIARDLLDMLMLQLGQMKLQLEGVELNELIESTTQRHPPFSSPHRIRLTLAESVTVQADRTRIEQVINTLLDNAVRFSPAGGEIDVALQVRDNVAVVSVRDHGVGIPKDKQEHIFQRLYRAHTDTPYDYGGMGSGLYIAREIIARHGGAIWVESDEGAGSTFFFSLPEAK